MQSPIAESKEICPACGVHLFLCDCHNQAGEPVQADDIVSQDNFRLTPDEPPPEVKNKKGV